MISVERLFKRVNHDLATKNMAGYTDSLEFTRHLRDSENILFNYNYQFFDKEQKITDSLDVFLVEEEIVILNGVLSKPPKYRHLVDIGYKLMISNKECGKPSVDRIPMEPLKGHEVNSVLDSYIKKPSFEKKLIYYSQVNNRFEIHPNDLTGKCYFKYFKHPVYGVYSTTIDPIKKIEVYDSVTSTDLQWSEQEEPNIVNLVLLHKGMAIRESDLVSYAITKIQKEEHK